MASAHSTIHAFGHKQGSTQPHRQEYHPTAERRSSLAKAISPKQNQFISTLASKAGRTSDEVAKSLIGKPLEQCSAADANTIIRHLKDGQANDNNVPG